MRKYNDISFSISFPIIKILFIAHYNYGGRIFITSPKIQWNLEENMPMIIVNIVPADILASLGTRASVDSVIITTGTQICMHWHLGCLADHIYSHDGNRFRYNIKWWVSIPLIPTGRNWRWNCSYMLTSWHGNVSGVSGPLWWQYMWDSPHKGSHTPALTFSLMLA